MTEQTFHAAAGLAVALLGGFAVGMIYFAVLWQSTRRFLDLSSSAGPSWMLLGFVLRLGFVLLVLLLALKAGSSALQLLVATAGFTVARVGWTRQKARQG